MDMSSKNLINNIFLQNTLQESIQNSLYMILLALMSIHSAEKDFQ